MRYCFALVLSFLLLGHSSYSQVSFENAKTLAEKFVTDNKLTENSRRNIYTDAKNVIHVFMYEDGNFLLLGYPTTATERNKYQVHLYYDSSKHTIFRLEVDGSYEPKLTVDNKNTPKETFAPKLGRMDFAIVGPFTGSVSFTLKKKISETEYTVLNSSTIKVARTIHASVGSGFVYSTLKNPTNIRVAPKDNSETGNTLLADNPKGTATLSLMATLYPWGRTSLMLPGESFTDKLGIVIGTTITSTEKNFKNLYIGLQIDFAIGGSFVLGADIGERQKIHGIDFKDFEFGETEFIGDLENKLYKQVGAGFFFGVQVDSRIFTKMFTPGG